MRVMLNGLRLDLSAYASSFSRLYGAILRSVKRVSVPAANEQEADGWVGAANYSSSPQSA